MGNESPLTKFLRDMITRIRTNPTDPYAMIFMGISGVIIVGILWNLWKLVSWFLGL